MQTSQEFKVNNESNKELKVNALLSQYDSGLMETEDDSLKPFEVRKKEALAALYSYVMMKRFDDKDNRWLLIFNILSAMRERSKSNLTDTHTVIGVGKSNKGFTQFISYITTEWNRTWVDYHSYDKEVIVRFTNTHNGKRTDDDMSINFNAIKDIQIVFKNWLNQIEVTLISEKVDYRITFSGLNDIINKTFVTEGNNE